MEVEGCWHEDCEFSPVLGHCQLPADSMYLQACGFEMLYQESKGRAESSKATLDSIKSSVRLYLSSSSE